MVSFGDLGSLIDIGTLPCRWRSKVDCIQDAVDPLSEQIRTPRFSPRTCRRTRQAIDVRIGAGRANPRRLLLET